MGFRAYKNVEQVLEKYPLAVKHENFLPDVQVTLSALVKENLDFSLSRRAMRESEIFWRENFIYPFLQEAWKQHPNLKLWSNRTLHYDDDLSGEPDYFLAEWSTGKIIEKLVNTPLLAVVEAKRQGFDEGWGQCLAAMIACQKLNESQESHKDNVVYGIVSTGMYWEFGKLEQSTFTQNIQPFSIHTPEVVLGILDYIFAECEKQLS